MQTKGNDMGAASSVSVQYLPLQRQDVETIIHHLQERDSESDG
jgi:hypothetical protein